MRIAIEPHALLDPHKDGTRIYAHRLVTNLLSVTHDCDFVFPYWSWRHWRLSGELRRELDRGKDANADIRIRWIPWKASFAYGEGPTWMNAISRQIIRATIRDCDVYHAPAFVSISADIPVVVTVFDLWPFRDLHGQSIWNAEARRLIRQGVSRSTHLIAISESTKRNIVEILDYDPHRISVVHLGVDNDLSPAEDLGQARFLLRKKYQIDRPYILFVGAIEHRKNIPTLLHAFAQSKLPGSPLLVLAGKPGEAYKSVCEAIATSGIEDNVRLLGYVERQDMSSIYSCAALLIMPSWFEGFGLPALEAMACRTPVIATRVGALPEVVGDAAILLDNPGDVAAMSEQIVKLFTDSGIRDTLRQRGLVRVREFTWKRCAEQTIRVYHQVASGIH